MRAALALVLVASVAAAAPWDVEPPPRGHWSKDLTGRVPPETLAELDAIAGGVDAVGAGQLGVLVVDSTAGVRPRDFATGVFNGWGVGHATRRDGVLLFLALRDRKAEIILGDGAPLQPWQSDAVMRDEVVPRMKAGDLPGALRGAARALAAHMRRQQGAGSPDAHPDDNVGLGANRVVPPGGGDAPEVDENLAMLMRGELSFPERSPRSWVVELAGALSARQRAGLDVAASEVYATDRGRIFFLVVRRGGLRPELGELARRFVTQVRPLSRLPMAVLVVDAGSGDGTLLLPDHPPRSSWEEAQLGRAVAELRARAVTDPVGALEASARFAEAVLTRGYPPRPMNDALREGVARFGGWLVGLSGALLLGGALGLARWLRHRPRGCGRCGAPRQRLGEAEDDAHLAASQQAEERLGSVDYDVWWCGRCNDAEVIPHGRWFSRYSTCRSCGAKAVQRSTTTLKAATEYAQGLQRVDHLCRHCQVSHSTTHTTARLPARSSSSSRSTFSSSSTSRSSSSARSSFGGGSSSGRGSSGSW